MAAKSRSKQPVSTDHQGRKRGTPPLPVTLDRHSEMPIFRQIYGAIREAILSGRLPSGSRLPPSRTLAEDLNVARMTVVLAYEHLEAEGYVNGRGSAGTFVADLTLPAETHPSGAKALAAPAAESNSVATYTAPVPFRIGEPALDVFPTGLWTRLYSRCARRSKSSLLGYGDTSGYLPLRHAIANYVCVSRSVRATADQVILVRGAQQAMDLVARVLLQPGDQVWVEDPGYNVARTIIKMATATVIPVPVDNEGLIVEMGIREAPSARMVCVAPSHHFPMGCMLSLSRRLALLEWARETGAWVIEDDYDSEFRYTGAPIASLQGLDNAGRVIYIGTFSKTVFPALRLGYLIVPPELVDRFRAAALAIDYLSPTVEQATLTAFIEEGHFTRHVRRMRAVYRERREAIMQAAARELSGLLQVEAADTGMHVIGWLSNPRADDATVSTATREQGIETRPLSAYCIKAALPPALVMGFAAFPPKALQAGIRALRPVLAAFK